MSHEKNLVTFHYTGWLIGILIMVHYNPYITGSYNPLYNQTNQILFDCSHGICTSRQPRMQGIFVASGPQNGTVPTGYPWVRTTQWQWKDSKTKTNQTQTIYCFFRWEKTASSHLWSYSMTLKRLGPKKTPSMTHFEFKLRLVFRRLPVIFHLGPIISPSVGIFTDLHVTCFWPFRFAIGTRHNDPCLLPPVGIDTR